MLVKEIPIDIDLPNDGSRTQGVHVSSIIRCLAMENKILEFNAEDFDLVSGSEITDPSVKLRMMIGIAWERLYLPVVLEKYGVIDHPGEVEEDGVYMTQDGESLSVIVTLSGGQYKLALQVHEVKATYKSVKTVSDLKSQWMWLAQIKAYCKAKKTRHAVLHVLFLCGNYKYPITPQNRAWQLEFTQEEIDSNWDLLRTYKEQWEGTRLGQEKWLE